MFYMWHEGVLPHSEIRTLRLRSGQALGRPPYVFYEATRGLGVK
jgi:hypothetical protein